MRIALVHRDLHAVTRGGICTLYRALAVRMRDIGHEVVLITQETPHPLTEPGIRVVILPRTGDLAAHRAAVTRTLTELAPDVVEASSWEAEVLDYVALPRGLRAPVVVRGDLSAATMQVHPLVDDEAALLRAADAVVAVSEWAADDLAGAYRIPRPTVVANGIDRGRFHPGPVIPPRRGDQITLAPDATADTRRPLTAGPLPPPWEPAADGRRRVVWVGKATQMKGWDLLERIVTELADLVHVTVLLGHARGRCPVTVTGREENLTVVQDIDEADVPSMYRAADYLLSTSRWEGFGLAIGEALACGTPALLPEYLGTAPELLAAGGGRTFRTVEDLRALLVMGEPLTGRLPDHFDWDLAAGTTLILYAATLRRYGRTEVA